MGQSRVLVVQGEAGIGKTALLDHLIDAASGFTVAHLTGVESAMELPFAALHQLCAAMLDRLGTLPGPQEAAARTAFGLTTGGPPDRLLIGLAILSLLSDASNDRPLLCVVDDAQWLDRESTQALTFVARRLLAEPICLVFATREPNTYLAGFAELIVESLREGDARTLLSTVLHRPVDERLRDRIVAETRGNPLALVEWTRGMDPAELAGGFAMPAVMPMSSQIEESFRRRVKELPTPTQRFLIVAAAEPTGDPGTVWQAAKRLGIRPDEAAPAIDAGLIEIGMRVRFWHPLVRSAVYGGARVVDRQAAHRALAEATDPDEEPDRRAWHRALGSAAPDDDVADALERSADGARARGGLAAAAVLLERSFELTVDVPRRAERALSAVAAHIESASFDRAHALLANAEALPLDEMSHARVEMLRSRLSMFDGHARTAAGLMLRAAQHLEPLDAGLAVRAHLLALGAAYVAGTLGEGVSITDIALAASRCPMPLDLTIEGRLLTGLAQLTIDGPAAAAAALREALEMLPPETNSPETIQLMALQRGVAAVLWDIDAYQNCATSHVATMRAWRALTMLPVTLNALAHVRILTGDLDGARAAVTEANQLYAASGSKSWASAEPSLAALRGMDGAASSIDGQIQAARAADSGSQLKLALWASATLHNGLGQYDKALAVASEAMEHPWVWSGHLSFHELIEAAARCGQRDAAAAALERLVDTAAPCGSEWAMGIVCRSRALLAVGAAAEDLFREAIDLLTRTTLRPELARAHLLYGEWLRREGRRVDARAQLRSAYEMFAGMGIRAFGERARLELVTVGEMVRAPTADSFDTLTPQEAQIALLAADLHTNVEIGAQLFLSPRTVEWHLRKVFPKLKVSSRRELRVALSRERHLTAAP